MSLPLPPGQYELGEFPRFGLPRFAYRFPKETGGIALNINGDVATPLKLVEEFRTLTRVEQMSDFHCVTTWSCRSLCWSGFRFAEFFERVVLPKARPAADAVFVLLRCHDGYVTSLPLEDMLANQVILADRLNEEPLTVIHGAPLRLVAPAHYGYKNCKHLAAVEFWRDERNYRPSGWRFMDHPRARVAFEERGRSVPGWLLRPLYRAMIGPVARRFKRALKE